MFPQVEAKYFLLCSTMLLQSTRYMEASSISTIEQYVIDRVRELRIAKGISQRDLSRQLDLTDGFVGKVETPKERAKYNLNHLNDLAKIFECSPKDFLPGKPF